MSSTEDPLLRSIERQRRDERTMLRVSFVVLVALAIAMSFAL